MLQYLLTKIGSMFLSLGHKVAGKVLEGNVVFA